MTRKFHASQTVTISGDSCGTEVNLKMSVDFTVHPGCKQTLTEPGEEPSVEVNKVSFEDGIGPIDIPWSIEDRITRTDSFKAWLMAEASEQHAAAIDDAAESKREERDLDRDLPF